MSITKNVLHNWYSSMKNFLERFGWFLTYQIDFESQNFAHFDDFYLSDPKTYKLSSGLVIVFGPKGRPDRMCNSVR
jgi:uncharacterized protein with ParB-like and HNH nuclease domain